MGLGFIPVVMSGLVSVVMYSLIIFSAYKIFQISGEVKEIKDLLRDLKRDRHDLPPGEAQLSEALRAYSEDPALRPEPADWDK